MACGVWSLAGSHLSRFVAFDPYNAKTPPWKARCHVSKKLQIQAVASWISGFNYPKSIPDAGLICCRPPPPPVPPEMTMLDDDTCDALDDTGDQSAAEREAREATAAVLARKPPKHPKYAFRLALQSSPEVKGATKLVGLLLADFVNVGEGYAYPTLNQISGRLGMPETTVKRALRNLTAAGWFRRESTKTKTGADGRNNWHPIYSKTGASDVGRVGGHFEPLGGHGRPPHLIHTGSFMEGLATLAPSEEIESKEIQLAGFPVDSSRARPREEPLTPARPKAAPQPQAASQADKVAMRVGWKFPAAAVEAAKARGITGEQIDPSLAKFRAMATEKATDKRTLAVWDKAGTEWLAKERAVTGDPNEMVTVGGGLWATSIIKRAFLKPGQHYTDSAGKRCVNPGQAKARMAL